MPTGPRAPWRSRFPGSPARPSPPTTSFRFRSLPRDAKLRVIYMEGSPLPEYRYIQDALEEDPNITCVSMTTDNMHAAHPRLYRIADPRRGYPSNP